MSQIPKEINSIYKTSPSTIPSLIPSENKFGSFNSKILFSDTVFENYNSNINSNINSNNENNNNNGNNEQKNIFHNVTCQNMIYQNVEIPNIEIPNIKIPNIVTIESKQQSTEENEHKNKNFIYDSIVFNSKKINIYQYKYCPHKFFRSLLTVLKEELVEPYCIFMLRDLLDTHGDVSLIATIEENDNKYMTVGVIVNKINIRYEENKTSFAYDGHICMLAVQSAFQGIGIGSYLLEESIKLMQKYNHVTSVSLDAASFNIKSLRFYERHEFIRKKKNLRYYVLGADSFELIRFV